MGDGLRSNNAEREKQKNARVVPRLPPPPRIQTPTLQGESRCAGGQLSEGRHRKRERQHPRALSNAHVADDPAERVARPLARVEPGTPKACANGGHPRRERHGDLADRKESPPTPVEGIGGGAFYKRKAKGHIRRPASPLLRTLPDPRNIPPRTFPVRAPPGLYPSNAPRASYSCR